MNEQNLSKNVVGNLKNSKKRNFRSVFGSVFGLTIFFLFFFLKSWAMTLNVGEKFVYKLSGEIKEWRLRGNIGTVTIDLKDKTKYKGKDVYYAIAKFNSSFLLNTRYKINDLYEVWFDVKTFKPYLVKRTLNEGPTKEQSTTRVFFSKKYGNYAIINKKKKKAHQDWSGWHKKKVYFSKGQKVLDVVSFFYYMRTRINQVDKKISVSVFNGSKTFPLMFKITRGGVAKIRQVDPKHKLPVVTIAENKKFHVLFNMVVKDAVGIPVSINAFTLKAKSLNIHLSGKVFLKKYEK